MNEKISVAVLTISDRASLGIREDQSGPALVSILENHENYKVVVQEILPDEYKQIRECLIQLCDQMKVDIILTTGGTGFSQRDITPEATKSILQKEAPGLCELMRFESYKKTPHAMLSRAVAGIREKTIIINLPGSPKAAIENLEVVLPILPHAVQLINNSNIPDSEHQFQK